MGLIVQKFGGTSVATAEKIHRAARRAIRAKLAGDHVVMVVSAMGHSTDELIALARQVSDAPPRREMDMLLTTGEQVTIALVAMAIHAGGHKAISLTAAQLGLYTDSQHSKARIQRISRDRIDRELADDRIVIVAGFQGIDPAGEITTLGRGASDTTAVALAAVMGADLCEIYTDVDGVYSSDPRLVPQARKLDRVGYDVMLELAGGGAGVMHSRAVEFGKKHRVPIHVRSSLTDASGTMITNQTHGMEEAAVEGVSLKQDIALIRIAGVPNRPGAAAEIFQALAQEGVMVDDILQNVYDEGRMANLTFSVNEADLEDARRACGLLLGSMGLSGFTEDADVCKVSAVGAGMRTHYGVAARMFRALADQGINIENITTSEIVISCILRRGDGLAALRAVHDTFGLGENPEPSAPSGA